MVQNVQQLVLMYLDPGYNPMILEYILQINLFTKRTPTFGTACIGMKVDGDLHPQVMTVLLLMTLHRFSSDGIGYWVTNLDVPRTCSLVFTYYCPMITAENGGKILLQRKQPTVTLVSCRRY